MNKLLFGIAFISFLFSSCSEPENRFIDIEKMNAEILENSGIDILAFKKQIEQDFEVDDAFYDSILVETMEKNTNKVMQKHGYYSVRTNGDTITSSDLDSIVLHFTKGFAHGIIQEKCSNSDSLCITKMEYLDRLSSIELPYGRVENEIPSVLYYDLYKKEYLTKDELAFMTLWWYILSSAQGISDTEWHEERKESRSGN